MELPTSEPLTSTVGKISMNFLVKVVLLLPEESGVENYKSSHLGLDEHNRSQQRRPKTNLNVGAQRHKDKFLLASELP
jgi:hypothetical protein